MRITNSYVFPTGSADELIDLAVDQLTAYLADPSGQDHTRLSDDLQAQAGSLATSAGVVGIATGPLFVVRQGRGTVGDESIVAPAEVIYGNQDKPGVPFVRVIVETIGDAQTFGVLTMAPVQFVLDAYADEWQGLLNDGRESADAGSLLASSLFALLSPTEKVYPLLKTWGFTDPRVRAGAASFEGIELNRPLTFACELYYSS